MTGGTSIRRVALITGAGSPNGIGFAAAKALGRGGARIAIASTTERIHDRVAELAGAPISDQQLSRAVATYEQNVDSHVASDDDLARFVSQLHRTDSPPEPPTPEPMDADPDAFVAEVERFLRDQGDSAS